MTKLLQAGTAFRVMRAELMNCGVNYEDPPEEEESESVPTQKTVSWKSIVSTTFKTPQECVGQNRNPGVLRRSDTRNPRGISRGSSEAWNFEEASWSDEEERSTRVKIRVRAHLF